MNLYLEATDELDIIDTYLANVAASPLTHSNRRH